MVKIHNFHKEVVATYGMSFWGDTYGLRSAEKVCHIDEIIFQFVIGDFVSELYFGQVYEGALLYPEINVRIALPAGFFHLFYFLFRSQINVQISLYSPSPVMVSFHPASFLGHRVKVVQHIKGFIKNKNIGQTGNNDDEIDQHFFHLGKILE
ncbi:MAG: hypothetical protein Q3983_04225 [Capnocytophaga sp.]|nr:hypothetical protein [Capnocytophaga sp.]